jgi:hypothetical protein
VVVKIVDEKKYVLFFPDNCGEKKTFEIINKKEAYSDWTPVEERLTTIACNRFECSKKIIEKLINK